MKLKKKSSAVSVYIFIKLYYKVQKCYMSTDTLYIFSFVLMCRKKNWFKVKEIFFCCATALLGARTPHC